uniref:Protein F54F12.2, isoform a n=1 Tax=Haemonchus contortus TaxID=6289 RepID=W6NHZ0_HAECO
MVADFVKILEQMMNPRQAVTSFISAATGLAAVGAGTIYLYRLPDTAIHAKRLVVVLIIYGVLQMLLATAYFVTCMQTTIAVSKGVKDAFQIVVGLLVALVYVAISLVSMVVGVYGFYKTVALVSSVDYLDNTSMTYCPQILFYTSLVVFILHIVLIATKCCCCK